MGWLAMAGALVATLAFIILGVALCLAASSPIPGVNEPPRGGRHTKP